MWTINYNINYNTNKEYIVYVCCCVCKTKHTPVVVGFEGPVLADAQVLGLFVSQLCDVSIKRQQVKTGHKFI